MPGGRDDPHVGALLALVRAARPDRAGLDETEKVRLHAARHVADLVEEERAAVALRRQTLFVPVRAGEAAARMTEQLRFEQRLGRAGAVDRDERVRTPAAGVVNEPRDDLFADSGFTDDEHVDIGARGGRDILAQPLHRLALAEQELRG